MILDKSEIVDLYRRRAKRYDISAKLYRPLGFRDWAYRRQAVAKLELEAGNTVVELGCGTGLNFPLLREAVGPQGRIIGVDMTPAMLDVARARVQSRGWDNVDLVETDMGRYAFPNGIDGILSTLALTLAPDYERIIERGAGALRPGGRFVVLDLKRPTWAPEWLVHLAVWLSRPFGVTVDLAARHPWEAIERSFSRFEFEERYAGFAYIAVGETERPPSS